MKNIIDISTKHIETENAPARDITIVITDIVFDHKDKAILKHLINSGIDITALTDIEAAHKLANELSANDKLITSQKDVNIRYKKWKLSKASTSHKEPSMVYNTNIIKDIIIHVVKWCKTRKFQSFIPFDMLEECVAKAIYGDTQELDEQQRSIVTLAKNKFTDRFCVISPFNNKGYNLGSELMSIMYPQGVKYRSEKYGKGQKQYFIIKGNTITNLTTGEQSTIPNGTFEKRNETRQKIDESLYYSTAA